MLWDAGVRGRQVTCLKTRSTSCMHFVANFTSVFVSHDSLKDCSCYLCPAALQIRHRNRAETQLVRLDVSLSSAGTLVVGLSHHHTDFAPYRIDNCSSEVLHVQQVRARGQGAWAGRVRPVPGSRCLPATLLLCRAEAV